MDFISKPVISCAGDEDLLTYFENHCLSALSTDHVMWTDGKYPTKHSVRIEACFTRFRVDQLQSNVKCLSTGRPIRKLGTYQPLLYIYVISSNVSQFNSKGGRNAVNSWLSHLRARNVLDWLIIMINSEPQSGAFRIIPKNNVLNKIKNEFNIRHCERQLLQVPIRDAVDEKVYNDSWNQLVCSLREAIINASTSIINEYCQHLDMLSNFQDNPSWDFFEYFDRKEELAHMYMFLGAYDCALQEYDDVIQLFTACIQSQKYIGLQWLNQLSKLTSEKEYACQYLCNYHFTPHNLEVLPPKRIRDHNVSLLDLKDYLFLRQFNLLHICDRLEELALRGCSNISSTIKELNILNKTISSPVIHHELLFFLKRITYYKMMNISSLIHATYFSSSHSSFSFPVLHTINLHPVLKYNWIGLLIMNIIYNLTPDFTKQNSTADSTNSLLEILDNTYLHYPNLEYISINKDSKFVCLANSNSAIKSNLSKSILLDCNQNSLSSFIVRLIDNVYQSYIRQSRTVTVTNPPKPSDSPRQGHKDSLGTNTNNYRHLTIELWIILFNTIKHLGHLVGRWTLDSKVSQFHLDNLNLITNKTKPHLNQKPEGESFSIRHHLISLLSLPKVYANLFFEMGKFLIGLLKLINYLRRANEVICDLADFCFTQKNYYAAANLFETVLDSYGAGIWPFMETSLRIKLAWSLHLLLISKHEKVEGEFGTTKRYIQACFHLSAIPADRLKEATCSIYSKFSLYSQTTRALHEIVTIPSLVECSNPSFWWSEALDYLQTISLFSQDSCTFNMDPLFKLKSVELIGACDCGYQMISLDIVSKSLADFEVEIVVDASVPTYFDWQFTLNPNKGFPNYFLKSEHNVKYIEKQTKFHPINLLTSSSSTQQNRSTNSDANSNAEHKRSDSLSESRFVFETKDDSFRYQRKKLPCNTPSDDFCRKPKQPTDRLGSILTVAATLANKPAWKSQDQLNKMLINNSSDSNKLREISLDERTLSSHKSLVFPRSILKTPCPLSRRSDRPSFMDHPQLKLDEEGPQDSKFIIANTETTRTVLKHGSNKLTFISMIPGFLIPRLITMKCFERKSSCHDLKATNGNADDEKHQTENKDVSLVTFSQPINLNQYGPNWNDSEMLCRLLPEPVLDRRYFDADQKFYKIGLGFRHAIPVLMKFGKLGFSNLYTLSTGVYKVCSDDGSSINCVSETSSGFGGCTGQYLQTKGEYNLIDLKNSASRTSVLEDIDLVNSHSSNSNLINSDYLKFRLLGDSVTVCPKHAQLVSLKKKKTCAFSHPIPDFPSECTINMSEPLYVTANSMKDQFALSLPTGHFCMIPIKVFRSMAFNLTTIPTTMSRVIFSLRIAYVDLNKENMILPEKFDSCHLPTVCQATTFMLSNFKFCILPNSPKRLSSYGSFSAASTAAAAAAATAATTTNNNNINATLNLLTVPSSTSMNNLRSNSLHQLSSANEWLPNQSLAQEILKINSTNNLPMQERNLSFLDCDLVDTRCRQIFLNRLCPTTILWSVKSNDFDDFRKSSRDQPVEMVAYFQCTFSRVDSQNSHRKMEVQLPLL